MFIRTENGKSYVMVRDDNGKLEKRWVQTGRNLWGSYTQIRGGLTVDDFVAFPMAAAWSRAPAPPNPRGISSTAACKEVRGCWKISTSPFRACGATSCAPS